jgi:hypothetical protein
VSSRACASLVAQSLARSMTAVIPCQVAPVSSSLPPWQTRPPLQPELPSRTVQNSAPPGHPGHPGHLEMGGTRRVFPNSAEPPGERSRQLQFQLRSPPFATVRPAAVLPFPRRSESLRTGLNPRTSSWKACWGQPLTSSNLLSAATADQPEESPDRDPVGAPSSRGLRSGQTPVTAQPHAGPLPVAGRDLPEQVAATSS